MFMYTCTCTIMVHNTSTCSLCLMRKYKVYGCVMQSLNIYKIFMIQCRFFFLNAYKNISAQKPFSVTVSVHVCRVPL